ncbi:hypothetical protein IFR05_015679 [Cadophora sp. M221]|nr:hypothetical protein IFR05_015679 [Cadophora sp. M221]
MFFKASFSTAGAVALVITQCALQAWGHPVNNTDQFRILGKRAGFLELHCAGSDASNVLFALTEARSLVLAAQNSHKRVVEYLDKLNTFAFSYKADAWTWSATQTFEAFFGKAFFGFWKKENAAGRDRAKYIADALQNLADALAEPATMPFDIYCSDSWLDPYEFWDSRPGSETTEWISFAAVEGKCRSTAEGFYAVVFPKPPLYDNPIMTFCEPWLKKFGDARSAGQTIGNLYNSPMTVPWHIDRFIDFSLSAAILHELMHVQPVMFPSTPLGASIVDQPCPIQPGGAYGYHCITALAKANPDLAISNADTWSNYVIALALSNYNWATGFAILPSEGPEVSS